MTPAASCSKTCNCSFPTFSRYDGFTASQSSSARPHIPSQVFRPIRPLGPYGILEIIFCPGRFRRGSSAIALLSSKDICFSRYQTSA